MTHPFASIRSFVQSLIPRSRRWCPGNSWIFAAVAIGGCALHSIASAGDQPMVVSLAGSGQLAVVSVADDGKLTVKSQTAMEGRPGASCFDATGRNLYVGSDSPSKIAVLRPDGDGLQSLQTVDVPAKPSFLAIDPSGRFLVASYYQTGQVSVHRILGEGRLSNRPVQLLDVGPHAHCVTFDSHGKFVFVSHTSSNSISQFVFDNKSGKLVPNTDVRLQREPGSGPRHLGFHPGDKFAYGSDEQGLSVTAYQIDSSSGTLARLQTCSTVPANFDGKGTASHVEVHPSGKYVYVANRGHGTIAGLTIDAESGALERFQNAATEPVVRSFCIAPDGRYLVAAGQRSDILVSYRIADDGRLEPADKLTIGATPWWVTCFRASQTPAQISTGKNERRADAMSADGRSSSPVPASGQATLSLGQGTMAGEVGESSALLQTRLTLGTALNADLDLVGSPGVARFEWSTSPDFADVKRSPWQTSVAQRDYIVRVTADNLEPDTKYFYRVIFGTSPSNTDTGPTCSLRTLPGPGGSRPVKLIVGSCMNYIKFMHGRAGNAGGPLTATPEDKRLGFPAFVSMKDAMPDFFVGTGDIVYYDNPYRVSTTVEELRRCWHEQFRFPRMIEFFQHVPAYWSKDDHDYRYNDSDNETDRAPLPQTAVRLFNEQLPIAAIDVVQPRAYRTIRVSRDVQIWLTEGREFRSANDAPDGPAKSMWGKVQRDWIKSTLQDSDAKWKLIISPTPMVGPDDGYKKDNHTSLEGFRHEANQFFDWVEQKQIENLFLVCGDRHWQYHSIHPKGVNEFAVGALNDENSRMGVLPGAEFGTDPTGQIIQPYTSREPSGGYLQIIAGDSLDVQFFDDQATRLYRIVFP
ncbi:6-phosphogluconolactonase [Rubripirellula lacrimiformis]|uniref:6-phosphogluconolactonase n=1 Tax=Rubripirellula lacrimiformis TaxID=1930273 RepID=A0A517NDR1_9BACT|nr:beta-propeller fold lactonase family protein [Rubripirellula lacrimiformis]QDT05267.1 6-phosphogluconolactonase [Rubripirellula lacrimiformis]